MQNLETGFIPNHESNNSMALPRSKSDNIS